MSSPVSTSGVQPVEGDRSPVREVRGRVESRAVRIDLRGAVMLAFVAAVGLLAFTWPLLVTPDSSLAGSTQAPLVFALILPVVIGLALSELTGEGMDVKALAMLGVLSAVGAVLRPLGAGTAGIETVFFLLVLGGRVFGPGFGFILGNTTLFASALLTAGVGPWLPFQMISSGFVGLGAGLLPRCRGWLEIGLLALYGIVSAFMFGMLMDLSFWPFNLGTGTEASYSPDLSAWENLQRFWVFNLATAMGWNTGRAITNTVFIVLVGPAVLTVLRRAARRAQFV
ncbi:ECF transporter S component [Kytococcus sedentarius]|uniref:ECF transporter S component n=1 Tax=Kytococcus sedentarius TaxID=1276 RepID=UPI00387A43E1